MAETFVSLVGARANTLRKARSSEVSPSEITAEVISVLPVKLQVLSHFIDCVFGSSEKEKVHSLLKAVLSNVWPHLQNHR